MWRSCSGYSWLQSVTNSRCQGLPQTCVTWPRVTTEHIWCSHKQFSPRGTMTFQTPKETPRIQTWVCTLSLLSPLCVHGSPWVPVTAIQSVLTFENSTPQGSIQTAIKSYDSRYLPRVSLFLDLHNRKSGDDMTLPSVNASPMTAFSSGHRDFHSMTVSLFISDCCWSLQLPFPCACTALPHILLYPHCSRTDVGCTHMATQYNVQ